MRWLITGGCGFIGQNLLHRALRDPDTKVRIIDDASVGTREELRAVSDFIELNPNDATLEWTKWTRSRVEFIAGDIGDAAIARKVTAGANAVAHLAATTGVGSSVQDPLHDCITNVIGTLNYLEACRHNGVKRFVFASSGAAIGERGPLIREELLAHPASPYGASKLACEAYCFAYRSSFGMETVILRFGNCYGPLSSHKSSVVAKFIRDALVGIPWEIYGDGTQTRDFVFVEDVAEAIVLGASTEAVGGGVFEIASGTETKVLELATKIACVLRNCDVTPPTVRRVKARLGDVKRSYFNTSKAQTRLAWRPKVPLEEGLNRTVRWFLKVDRQA